FLRHRAFLITCAALFGVFQVITAAIISSLDLPNAFESFMAFAPPALRAIAEQTMPGGSAEGILAFMWNHPATHALVTAVAITLAARAIAGEIENGVIEMILAQPVSRARYFASHLTFGMVAIAAVAIVGLLGGLLGQVTFGLTPFAWERLLQLLASLFLL